MTTFRTGNIRMAVQSLSGNKLRSFMTMLGIIIGVMAVILAVGIGEGVKRQISTQTARFGPDVVVVRPGNVKRSVLTGDSVPGGSSALLTENDVTTIQQTPGVTATVPLSTISGSVKADTLINAPLIIATTPDFAKVINQKMEYGAFFEPESDTQLAVLGQSMARTLFEDSAPLGQTFNLRGKDFMVAGVFKQFSAPPLSLEANFNDAIFISYSTAGAITGSAPGIYQVLAKKDTALKTNQVADAIHVRLQSAHGGADDIMVTTAASSRGGSDQTLRLVTLMTIGVALIAFLVGGVGIMNSMLVSVTERIHEIGLRKAIGATHKQILDQFVAEALVLSVVGATVGAALAAATIGLLRLYTSLQPVIVWQMFLLAPLVAIASGVLFGTFPALQAARKDPIEALRHE